MHHALSLSIIRGRGDVVTRFILLLSADAYAMQLCKQGLGKVLPGGAQLHVENVFVENDVAIVKLHSEATAKNGLRFDNHYC
jgi:hypothetical protein